VCGSRLCREFDHLDEAVGEMLEATVLSHKT
jgi:hypothetical protein